MKILWTKVRQHMVDDWRHAWRWLSVWFAAALLALDEIAHHLPEVTEYLPKRWVSVLAVAILVGRVIRQAKPAAKVEAKPDAQ